MPSWGFFGVDTHTSLKEKQRLEEQKIKRYKDTASLKIQNALTDKDDFEDKETKAAATKQEAVGKIKSAGETKKQADQKCKEAKEAVKQAKTLTDEVQVLCKKQEQEQDCIKELRNGLLETQSKINIFEDEISKLRLQVSFLSNAPSNTTKSLLDYIQKERERVKTDLSETFNKISKAKYDKTLAFNDLGAKNRREVELNALLNDRGINSQRQTPDRGVRSTPPGRRTSAPGQAGWNSASLPDYHDRTSYNNLQQELADLSLQKMNIETRCWEAGSKIDLLEAASKQLEDQEEMLKQDLDIVCRIQSKQNELNQKKIAEKCQSSDVEKSAKTLTSLQIDIQSKLQRIEELRNITEKLQGESDNLKSTASKDEISFTHVKKEAEKEEERNKKDRLQAERRHVTACNDLKKAENAMARIYRNRETIHQGLQTKLAMSVDENIRLKLYDRLTSQYGIGRLEDKRRFGELWQVMKEAGSIDVGKYDDLRRLFNDFKATDCVSKIEAAEKELIKTYDNGELDRIWKFVLTDARQNSKHEDTGELLPDEEDENQSYERHIKAISDISATIIGNKITHKTYEQPSGFYEYFSDIHTILDKVLKKSGSGRQKFEALKRFLSDKNAYGSELKKKHSAYLKCQEKELERLNGVVIKFADLQEKQQKDDAKHRTEIDDLEKQLRQKNRENLRIAVLEEEKKDKEAVEWNLRTQIEKLNEKLRTSDDASQRMEERHKAIYSNTERLCLSWQKIVEDKENEIKRQEREHKVMLEDIKRTYSDEVEQMESNKKIFIADLKEIHQTEIKRLEKLNQDLQGKVDEKDNEMREMQQAFHQEMHKHREEHAELMEQNAAEQENIRRKHAEEVEHLRNGYKMDLDNYDEKWLEEISVIKGNHQVKLDDARKHYNEVTEKNRQDYETQINKLTKKYADQQTKLKQENSELNGTLFLLRKEHDGALTEVWNQSKKQLSELRNMYKGKIDELKVKLEELCKEIEEKETDIMNLERDAESSSIQNRDHIRNLETTHKKTIENLTEKHRKELDAKIVALKACEKKIKELSVAFEEASINLSRKDEELELIRSEFKSQNNLTKQSLRKKCETEKEDLRKTYENDLQNKQLEYDKHVLRLKAEIKDLNDVIDKWREKQKSSEQTIEKSFVEALRQKDIIIKDLRADLSSRMEECHKELDRGHKAKVKDLESRICVLKERLNSSEKALKMSVMGGQEAQLRTFFDTTERNEEHQRFLQDIASAELADVRAELSEVREAKEAECKKFREKIFDMEENFLKTTEEIRKECTDAIQTKIETHEKEKKSLVERIKRESNQILNQQKLESEKELASERTRLENKMCDEREESEEKFRKTDRRFKKEIARMAEEKQEMKVKFLEVIMKLEKETDRLNEKQNKMDEDYQRLLTSVNKAHGSE